MTETDTPLKNLPPSAKLVLKVLEHNEELTQKQIAAKSRLPQRTVRYALESLENKGFIRKRIHLADTRQNLYQISGVNLSAISESDESA